MSDASTIRIPPRVEDGRGPLYLAIDTQLADHLRDLGFVVELEPDTPEWFQKAAWLPELVMNLQVDWNHVATTAVGGTIKGLGVKAIWETARWMWSRRHEVRGPLRLRIWRDGAIQGEIDQDGLEALARLQSVEEAKEVLGDLGPEQ